MIHWLDLKNKQIICMRYSEALYLQNEIVENGLWRYWSDRV